MMAAQDSKKAKPGGQCGRYLKANHKAKGKCQKGHGESPRSRWISDCPRAWPVVVSLGSGAGVPPVNGHGQDGRATANDTATAWPEELTLLLDAGRNIDGSCQGGLYRLRKKSSRPPLWRRHPIGPIDIKREAGCKPAILPPLMGFSATCSAPFLAKVGLVFVFCKNSCARQLRSPVLAGDAPGFVNFYVNLPGLLRSYRRVE
jgi:hypothetical protein